MLSPHDIRAIDHQKERLVPAAEKLLEDARVVELRKNDFGDSQLRNLIAVAMETESPAVISNFIRYQMGRDTGRKSWRRDQGGVMLGDRLIAELEKGAVAEALDAIASFDGEPRRKQLVRMELVRHFLGFASRYLKYLDLQRGK